MDVELQPINTHIEEVFHRLDTDSSGTITYNELQPAFQSNKLNHDIPEHTRIAIFREADIDDNHALDLQEFTALMNHPQHGSIFHHLLHWRHRYVHFMLPPSTSITEWDSKYKEKFKLWPPPVIMLLLTVVIITLYFYDLDHPSSNHLPGPIAGALLYNPKRRKEAWRFISYMLVHSGITHLATNVIVLLILALPLEMVHGGCRILVIYLAGVVAGSLGTSIFDPTVPLVGASGGVYSLLTAHLATVILNWKDMSFPWIQLGVFLLFVGADVAIAVYTRYVMETYEAVAYAAHICGALVGFLVGITVLKNYSVEKWEIVLKRVAIALFILFVAFAVGWNIAVPTYFPEQVV